MMNPNTTVTWIDARAALPPSGTPVAAAITGRYPSGEDFWLVRPMTFTTRHFADDGTTEHRDCFVDSDGVVRLPYGLDSEETVTHWAELPVLPGGTTHGVLGEGVEAALREAWA